MAGGSGQTMPTEFSQAEPLQPQAGAGGDKGTGSAGQPLPNQFAQTQTSGGGDKGTGQPTGYGGNATATPMGTPIVYGKTYLPQTSLAQNANTSPLGNTPNQPITQAPNDGGGPGGA